MNQPGTIRLLLGLILVFGAVGGMDDPTLAEHFVEQMLLATVGLALIFWASQAVDQNSSG